MGQTQNQKFVRSAAQRLGIGVFIMSKVTEVIENVEALKAKLEKAHEDKDWTKAAKSYIELQQESRNAYEPLVSHINKLHEAINKIKNEYSATNADLIPESFVELFNLIPSENQGIWWTGD